MKQHEAKSKKRNIHKEEQEALVLPVMKEQISICFLMTDETVCEKAKKFLRSRKQSSLYLENRILKLI